VISAVNDDMIIYLPGIAPVYMFKSDSSIFEKLCMPLGGNKQ